MEDAGDQAPVVAWMEHHQVVLYLVALVVGTLLVLLAPCVDYVMVFTRLGGGAWSRILAASPALMLLQALVLPLWLAVAAGSPGAQGGGISWRPFAQAFILMIALPMGLSILTRRAAPRGRSAARLASATTALMVPLMMATLVLVVASQVPHVASRPDVVARVVPLFATFALVMPAVGDVAGRMARQGRQERLALAFSGTTRNSLVVLPLALALPDSMGMAPIVVVTQTLVELVVMAVGVRLLPRLIR